MERRQRLSLNGKRNLVLESEEKMKLTIAQIMAFSKAVDKLSGYVNQQVGEASEENVEKLLSVNAAMDHIVRMARLLEKAEVSVRG